MKIFCDTNIWYGIGNGSINLDEYGLPPLYATYVNIDELARTPNILYDLENVRGAIRAAMINAKYRTINDNPFIYMLKMENPDFKPDLPHDNAILELTTTFAKGGSIKDGFVETFNKDWIEPRQKELQGIADVYNELFDNIRKGIGGGVRANEYRKLDAIPFIKGFVKDRIGDWTEHHLGERKTLSDQFDWKQVELYLNTWASWYVELSVSQMRFQPNDAYDLSNLVYVAPNDKYWTKEVRWQRIIKDIAGLGHYLVEYKDENYFPKNGG
jgi:hypothetical protein